MAANDGVLFSSLIGAIAKDIGIPEAAASPDGIFRLEVEGTPLSIMQRGESILLYTSLGSLPTDEVSANAIRNVLLGANVLFQETRGATFGIVPEDGAIVLCWQTPMQGLGDADFIKMTEAFFILVEDWMKRLDEVISQPEQMKTAVATMTNPSWTSV
ncbi:MAG: type III secretion system chaperone [Deltaproteobacteria bacterium]|jgi:hypothetical protein|nr:type III secretion system chaperone [Deltaproteobacteria bacterium]